MTKKLLFVVHRYAPFPGGSEYYVQNMAEEALSRGYDVTVMAKTHQGNVNGVKVITQELPALIDRKWDLIIVHGGDVSTQDLVHLNNHLIKSPILYLIIKPSDSSSCMKGLDGSRYLGYSTTADIEWIKSKGFTDKARRVRHGVVPAKTIVPEKAETKDKQILAVGGWWPHKGFEPLIVGFMNQHLNEKGFSLHLWGYEGRPPYGFVDSSVYYHQGSHFEVMQAMRDADYFVMPSYEEGFGLTILEAALNKTPIIARNIAGAKDLVKHLNITTFESDQELQEVLEKLPNFSSFNQEFGSFDRAKNYVLANHTIKNTVNDIEDILNENQLRNSSRS